jgi:hypothetical protein
MVFALERMFYAREARARVHEETLAQSAGMVDTLYKAPEGRFSVETFVLLSTVQTSYQLKLGLSVLLSSALMGLASGQVPIEGATPSKQIDPRVKVQQGKLVVLPVPGQVQQDKAKRRIKGDGSSRNNATATNLRSALGTKLGTGGQGVEGKKSRPGELGVPGAKPEAHGQDSAPKKVDQGELNVLVRRARAAKQNPQGAQAKRDRIGERLSAGEAPTKDSQTSEGLRTAPVKQSTTGKQQGKGRKSAEAQARAMATRLKAARLKEAAVQLATAKLLRKQEIAATRRATVLDAIARRRGQMSEQDDLVRQMVKDRDQAITENKAYRAVSKQKGQHKAPDLNFTLGQRNGVTRGKKRGSEYFNEVIARASRSGRGGGRRGGRGY